MESIEKGYVLVNPHYASTDTLSSSMETSLLYNSATRVLCCPPVLKNDRLNISVERQLTKELDANNSSWREKDLQSHGAQLPSSSTSTVFREVLQLPILHPSTRLQLLHKYIDSVLEIAQAKASYLLF